MKTSVCLILVVANTCPSPLRNHVQLFGLCCCRLSHFIDQIVRNKIFPLCGVSNNKDAKCQSIKYTCIKKTILGEQGLVKVDWRKCISKFCSCFQIIIEHMNTTGAF